MGRPPPSACSSAQSREEEWAARPQRLQPCPNPRELVDLQLGEEAGQLHRAQGPLDALRTHETVAQFRVRMGKLVDYMNSDDFQAKDGTGLPGLCRSLRARCERVLADDGRRLPH